MQPSKEDWTHDGTFFSVFSNPLDQTVPIYQYHAAQDDGWRFHFSWSDKPAKEDWIRDGIAFYAYMGEV